MNPGRTHEAPAVGQAPSGVPARSVPLHVWLAPILVVVAAAIWPNAAVVAVWPVYFFIPGYLLVRRIVPRLLLPGRVGIGVTVSALASTHLVDLLGRIQGTVDANTALVAALLLWWLSVALWYIEIRGLGSPARPGWQWFRSSLRQEPGAFVVAGLGVVAVGGVLHFGLWHLGPQGWIAGGWNWSDLLVHTSIATSTISGNFPPQVPFFAGSPLTYPWFADFQAGVLALVTGKDVIPVMVVSSAILAGALGLCVWELAHQLTRSRRAAWLAGILALFGGGLGYIRLPLDVAQHCGSWWSLLRANSYDNIWSTYTSSGTQLCHASHATQWPFFNIPSVFGTGLIDDRTTTYGLPMMVSALLLLHLTWRRRDYAGVILTGVFAALTAPFSFFLFPCLYLAMGLHLVTIGRRENRPGSTRPSSSKVPDREWLKRAGCLFAPIILALPFILPAVLRQHTSGAVHLVLGWPTAPLSEGLLRVVFFYATNLGVPFVLALVALFWRGTPHRWFLAVWITALFIVPNVVVASAVSFDMNKIFQAMWIAVAIAAAWLIRRWPRPLIGVVIVTSVLSPVLVGIWTVRSGWAALSVSQVAAAKWIGEHTPQRSVFVTNAFINSPVDLSGRLRLSSFGPYVANYGYNPAQRQTDITAIYCDGPSVAATIMQKDRADYVINNDGGTICPSTTRTRFAASPLFTSVFDAGGVTVWKLSPTIGSTS